MSPRMIAIGFSSGWCHSQPKPSAISLRHSTLPAVAVLVGPEVALDEEDEPCSHGKRAGVDEEGEGEQKAA